MSKVFNDDWMREAGFLEGAQLGTVADLLRVSPTRAEIIMAQQNDKVSHVVELMRDKGISQLPVSDGAGWIKGVITESAILGALYQGRSKSSDTIEALLDTSIEFVTPSDPIEKVSRLVTAGKIPLINDSAQPGKLLGIITKIDLLAYLSSRH